MPIPQRAFQVTVTKELWDQAAEHASQYVAGSVPFNYPTNCPVALAVKPKVGRASFSVGGYSLTVGSGSKRKSFAINRAGTKLIDKFDSTPTRKRRLGLPVTVRFTPEN